MIDGENRTIEQTLERIKWDSQGLIPVIVQDAVSKDVLMLAYMNEESLQRSHSTGETWFWSRSRNELWHKGETSGHIQLIQSMSYDCDADTLLVRVKQTGSACHTGKYSCFFNDISNTSLTGSVVERSADAGNRFAILSALESVIAQRDAERPDGAYTTYLFEQGLDKILKKVGEEAAEVIIAAKNKDNNELRSEASDLIFHLMVLLRDAKLPLDDIMRELSERHFQ